MTGGCSACCRFTCWRRTAGPSCCRSASAFRITSTPLLDPDAPPDAAARLLAAALAASPEAACCDFVGLPPGAALREAAVPPGWRDEGVRPSEPCPVLALPSGAGLSEVLSRRRRAALRNARNRAERAGGIRGPDR